MNDTQLLADVSAYRDGLVLEIQQLQPVDTSDAEVARFERYTANLQAAIDGANDQIAMFERRVTVGSGQR